MGAGALELVALLETGFCRETKRDFPVDGTLMAMFWRMEGGVFWLTHCLGSCSGL